MSRIAAVIGAAAVIAAVSLLLPWALAFDPQAWVVWGRDVGRLALDTGGGPSWKPLPVVVTTPLALTGDPAPALWLIVARTGGLLAILGAAVLAARLAGVVAGAVAALLMALSTWWFFNTALGNSEGLLAAAVLWAVVAQLAGRPRAALALGAAAGLLRPEVWPFLGLYGLWLWRADRSARPAVVVVAIVVPLLWIAPDLAGTGGLASASRAARGEPSLGSAALEDVPFLAVWADFWVLLTAPAVIAAIAAVVWGSQTVRVLAAGAVAWVLIVAVMAQAGYAGNPRYLVAAAAIGCVLAGVGTARLAARVVRLATPVARSGARLGAPRAGPRAGGARLGAPRARLGALAGLVVVSVAAVITVPDLHDQAVDIGHRADRRAALSDLVAAAGGRAALVACRVHTAPDVRPLVAWELDADMRGIDRPPQRPDVVVRWRPHGGGPVQPTLDTTGYRFLAHAPGWEAWSSCSD